MFFRRAYEDYKKKQVSGGGICPPGTMVSGSKCIDANEDESECLPCPKGYSHNGVSCVSPQGCEIKEQFDGKICKRVVCPNSIAIDKMNGCQNDCKTKCENHRKVLAKSLEDNASAQQMVNMAGVFTDIEGYRKRDPRGVDGYREGDSEKYEKLKADLRRALQADLEDINLMKTCDESLCSGSKRAKEVISQYQSSFCPPGAIASSLGSGCVNAKCILCAEANDAVSNYRSSTFRIIGCGTRSDELTIWKFLLEQAVDEMRERNELCESGRVGVCKEFEGISDADFRTVAQQVGLSCKGSGKKTPSQSGGGRK